MGLVQLKTLIRGVNVHRALHTASTPQGTFALRPHSTVKQHQPATRVPHSAAQADSALSQPTQAVQVDT